MKQGYRAAALVGILCLVGAGFIVAQETTPPDCSAAGLAQQQQTLVDTYPLDFAADTATSQAHLFRLGIAYQQLAQQCGYVPTADEAEQMVNLTLSVTTLETIIQALAVGTDVTALTAELADLRGDPQRGQLLYNGLEPVLDGTLLGCAGCHNGQTAPAVEGSWTRANDVRLQDAALVGYTVEQYFIESIVHPNGYIAPDFLPDLMPTYYGSRLDAQMLADLVAFLDSQDQLLQE
jgi:hypothetical protein